MLSTRDNMIFFLINTFRKLGFPTSFGKHLSKSKMRKPPFLILGVNDQRRMNDLKPSTGALATMP